MHIVRSQRPLYWIIIVLLFPYLGMVVYFIAAVLPDLRDNPGSRRVLRNVKHTLDPQREKRAASRRLDLSDTLKTAAA